MYTWHAMRRRGKSIGEEEEQKEDNVENYK